MEYLHLHSITLVDKEIIIMSNDIPNSEILKKVHAIRKEGFAVRYYKYYDEDIEDGKPFWQFIICELGDMEDHDRFMIHGDQSVLDETLDELNLQI